MGIKLGNTTIGSLYLGSTKISEAYLGSTQLFSSTPAVQYPYLLLQCDGYGTDHPSMGSSWNGAHTWTQVSTSPNVWKLEITSWAVHQSLGCGPMFLFSKNSSPPVGSITSSCRLIGSGNMDVALNGLYCDTFDRMFGGCTGLEYIEPIHCTRVKNVGGMFTGCTNVQEGALAQYNWFNTYGVNINNHSGTFTDCGANTTTGLADLNQIPTGWGGNFMPASTLMTSSRMNEWGQYSTWRITDGEPDWTNVIGMNFFTSASVSQYSGIAMNRRQITKRNGLGTTQGTYDIYVYPAFVQYSGSSSSNRVMTWVATTDLPNDHLEAGERARDMSATLDYSTYGPITRTYGTYDSGDFVNFCFFVTNVPIAQFTGLSDAYGVLYDRYLKTDGGFRYFF